MHCHVVLCLKAVLHAPDCARERCGYDWQKTPESINGCKTKIFLGQQLPASVAPRETGIEQEEWNKMMKRQKRGLKQYLRKTNKKKKVSKVKRKFPQKLNKDIYVAGAIHTDPDVLPRSILKMHNERYPYNTTCRHYR